MIDCGEADDAEELLSKLALRGAEKLDLMILTHFDSDHIGSAAAILASVPTERILLPDHSPEADDLSDYRACMEAAAKSGAELCYVHDTEALTLGGIKLTVYGAGDAEYTKNRENNRSLLLLVEHAQNRLFFAGDAEKQRLEDWLAGETVRADFLKLPHHGSYNKALPDLLASVGMRSAVITCSAKNPPDEKTLLALGDCETYLTADGDVTIVSDSAGLSLRQG